MRLGGFQLHVSVGDHNKVRALRSFFRARQAGLVLLGENPKQRHPILLKLLLSASAYPDPTLTRNPGKPCVYSLLMAVLVATAHGAAIAWLQQLLHHLRPSSWMAMLVPVNIPFSGWWIRFSICPG